MNRVVSFCHLKKSLLPCSLDRNYWLKSSILPSLENHCKATYDSQMDMMLLTMPMVPIIQVPTTVGTCNPGQRVRPVRTLRRPLRSFKHRCKAIHGPSMDIMLVCPTRNTPTRHSPKDSYRRDLVGAPIWSHFLLHSTGWHLLSLASAKLAIPLKSRMVVRVRLPRKPEDEEYHLVYLYLRYCVVYGRYGAQKRYTTERE
ncbi:uncharacterized protein F5147DRAFT_682812 [Suillus discolor]|uniref:Uncharacterized protein n=1 Tax=Suillus discolor TaxID=1912936 RepID=A0A9P7FCV0_9AGAM|nr:uncharacterized protein F5147DRAFT_682812 [Suillus discolor]KAG2113123.1 hypothetical protein F5147DRAFT_682812 [Suillus discolor]